MMLLRPCSGLCGNACPDVPSCGLEPPVFLYDNPYHIFNLYFMGKVLYKLNTEEKIFLKKFVTGLKKKKCNYYTRVEFTTIFQINNEFTELGKNRVSFHFY